MNRNVYPDVATVAREAASAVRQIALEAVQTRGRFIMALSGGSTPKATYEHLATLELPWTHVHLCWGDDRCVPPDDERSNYRMAKEALLDKIDIPERNVHRICTELEPARAALDYAQSLEKLFKGDVIFDLVHLGLGPDGHIASLFDDADLELPGAVVNTFPEVTEPFVTRVSLGLKIINAARNVHFLVTGSSKAQIVASFGQDRYPADRVRASNLKWFMDAAASGIKS
jgi:6-phosphogluconolactonase